MKRFGTKQIGALFLASVLAVPAYAGALQEPRVEPVIQPQPMAPLSYARDWTGPYVGAQLGYGRLGGTMPDDSDITGDGWVGGLHAGYNFDFGNFIAGGELTYDRTGIKDQDGDGVDDVAKLKLRAGPKLGDAFVYGTAGVASAKHETEGRDTGWVAGVGMEFAVGDNWSVGAELLHHRFKDFGPNDIDVRANSAQARVSFRF